MNRDEMLTRVEALPPKLIRMNGRVVLCPSEPGGGTWIALNDSGATLALINWYSVTQRVEHGNVSRGEVVKTVAAASTVEIASAGLQDLPLKNINPFRLIGVFPGAGEIGEWRWNLTSLSGKKEPWRTQQWISSGFDEPAAQRVRGETFRNALLHRSSPGAGWLRKLHSSHAPQAGPFSTCMHRSNAATVSYTEITVSSRTATMRYHPGFPCERSTNSRKSLACHAFTLPPSSLSLFSASRE